MLVQKISVGLWLFGALSDRFTQYHPPRSLEEKFKHASNVPGCEGVEVVYPAEFKYDELDKFKSLLKQYKLEVSGLIVDVFTDPKWSKGSFTSRNEQLRKLAIKTSTETVDVAKELGCKMVTLWLGQDGYDYPFQVDYNKMMTFLVEGIREVATHDVNVNIGLEYKLKEPRTHIYLGTASKAVLVANEVGLKNVGVTLDVGHAFYAWESPSESLLLLNRYDKLFHIHFNDNYRDWDHDMIVGSVNLWDTLEFFYWLKKIDYNGWLALDIYPYREDVGKACARSIENIKLMRDLVDKVGVENLDRCVEEGDATETMAVLRKIFG